jgi:predicted RNA-binding protein YlxR (DUF448 family)
VTAVGSEPVRTCVGCRARATKSELVRIVAGPDGLVVDRRGDAPGRGAYVHRDPACLEVAERPGVLGRALRRGPGRDEVGRLMLGNERMGAV